MKRLLTTVAWLLFAGVSAVRANVATYSNPTLMVTGCPGCSAKPILLKYNLPRIPN